MVRGDFPFTLGGRKSKSKGYTSQQTNVASKQAWNSCGFFVIWGFCVIVEEYLKACENWPKILKAESARHAGVAASECANTPRRPGERALCATLGGPKKGLTLGCVCQNIVFVWFPLNQGQRVPSITLQNMQLHMGLRMQHDMSVGLIELITLLQGQISNHEDSSRRVLLPRRAIPPRACAAELHWR